MEETHISPPPPPPPPTTGRRRWPWIVGVVAVIIIVIAIASGSDDEPTKRTAVDVTDEAPTTTSDDATPPAVEEPIAPPSDSGIAQVGSDEWFTWDDGVEAQVTTLEQINVEYAVSPGPHVAATITVRNGSGATVDLILATAHLYSGPNGVQAEADGLYGFDGSVPPGGTATAQYAWAVPAEHFGQLRVEFSPSFSHGPAFYEGAVG